LFKDLLYKNVGAGHEKYVPGEEITYQSGYFLFLQSSNIFQKENIVLQNLMSQTFRTMGLPYNMSFLFNFLAAGACDL
jgi:hypothetical protein